MSTKTKSVLTGLAMFLVVALYTIFLAAPIQASLGMAGLLLTELGFLALALGGAFLLKVPLRQMFPLRRPTLRQTIGTVVLWLGAYVLVLLSAVVLMVFFPNQMGQVTDAMGSMFSSVPLWLRYLIVAVSPAICEEAVHRGFILNRMNAIQSKALRVVVMGVLFGIFHLDPYRFLPTALLGAALSYAAIETGNLFYPFLIHLINNSLSVLATAATPAEGEAASGALDALGFAMIGSYLIFAAACPWLLWLAASLLRPAGSPKRPGRGRRAALCAVVSVLCVAGGAFLCMQDAVFLQQAGL